MLSDSYEPDLYYIDCPGCGKKDVLVIAIEEDIPATSCCYYELNVSDLK